MGEKASHRLTRRDFVKGLGIGGSLGLLAGLLGAQPLYAQTPQPERIISAHEPVAVADVIVKKVGEKAVAINSRGERIAESTDHTQVIQTAIENGGLIYIVKSSTPYLVEEEITDIPDGTKIVSNGAILKRNTPDINIFRLTDKQNVEIYNLEIDGNRTIQSDLGKFSGAFLLEGCANVKLVGLKIYNTYSSPVVLTNSSNKPDGCEECEILYCNIENPNGDACIEIKNNSHRNVIAYNALHNTGEGVLIKDNANDNVVIGNLIYDGIKGTNQAGTPIQGSGIAVYNAIRNIIAFNVIKEFKTTDISKYWTAGCGVCLHDNAQDNVVIGNVIVACENAGIMLAYNARRNIIVGNKLFDNNRAGANSEITMNNPDSEKRCTFNLIAYNVINETTQQASYAIEEQNQAYTYQNYVQGNIIDGISPVYNLSLSTKRRATDPEGRFRNKGTATIEAGSTSVTVNHGLLGTPRSILVIPIGDPGDRWWVENVTDTSFDIVVATAPTSNITFYWLAEV